MWNTILSVYISFVSSYISYKWHHGDTVLYVASLVSIKAMNSIHAVYIRRSFINVWKKHSFLPIFLLMKIWVVSSLAKMNKAAVRILLMFICNPFIYLYIVN